MANLPWGDGRVFRRGRRWWIAYFVFGREVRESSYSEHKAVAIALLDRRIRVVKRERAYRQDVKALEHIHV